MSSGNSCSSGIVGYRSRSGYSGGLSNGISRTDNIVSGGIIYSGKEPMGITNKLNR